MSISKGMIINSRGTTLIELMVAMFITSVVLLSVSSMLVFQVASFSRSKNEIQSELELMRVETEITKVLQQAMNLGVAFPGAVNIDGDNNVSINTYNMPGSGEGRIRTFTPSTSVVTGVSVRTIAVFNREAGERGSQILPTGIFYAEPTPTTSGIIFIDFGSEVNASGVLVPELDGRVEPSYDDLYISNIVEFEVRNLQFSSDSNLADRKPISVEFRVVLRYFGANQVHNFCSMALINSSATGCENVRNFYDVERVFRVALRNNGFGNKIGGHEPRLHGLIHFYRTILPTR